MTSSPLFAQSNGKAEKGVHIVKQLLRKAQDSGSDPYLALLSYRASPVEHGKSPAELLMERRLRTTLPYTAQQRKHLNVRKKLRNLQKTQKLHCDKSLRSLTPLARHDVVRVGDFNIWSRKATVLEEVGPRSYTVKTEDGQILRRNRRSLLKTPETLQQHEEEPQQHEEELQKHDSGQVVTASADLHPTAADSSVSAEAAEWIGTSPVTPVVRRSARSVKAPNRLNL